MVHPSSRRSGRLRVPALLAPVCAAMLVVLAGCGFRPMYGSGRGAETAVPGDLAAVEVAPIADASGQRLRNTLEQLLNPAAEAEVKPRYTLSVQLGDRVDTFAVERTGFATRANVEMVATYTLTDNATAAPVLAGSSRAVSGFNILDNDVSTLVAAGDARGRAIQQLAYQIRNRLASHFSAAATSGGGV